MKKNDSGGRAPRYAGGRTPFRFSPGANRAHLIKWRQWGGDALEEARRADKLLVLSLSAVWCHWCHVMDETTYSDDKVIDFINENFIAVRVDSDMRPDIDNMYNQGGWPSTVILTPEGDAIGGGTYMPPGEMLRMLSDIERLFHEKRDSVKGAIERLKKEMATKLVYEASPPETGDILKIRELISGFYDPVNGGFGYPQKFPNTEVIDFLLSEYAGDKDPALKEMITTTLRRMCSGGIRDMVEGGFFRYSTRPDWSEPHYEKMLEGNAGLIGNYSNAYMVFEEELYRDVVEDTVRYIGANLFDAGKGAFLGSQDADEEYYKKEDRAALKRPFIDRTVYADSSSRMVSALAGAYSITGNEKYLDMSCSAAGFIMRNMFTEEEGVFHYFSEDKKLSGILSDNVLFAHSLIDLYNATGKKKYFLRAEKLVDFITGRFYDDKNKQFRASLNTEGVIPHITGPHSDFNKVLANLRAVILLCRAAGSSKGNMAKEVLSGVRDSALSSLAHAALYGAALRWHMGEPVEFAIVSGRKKLGGFLSAVNRIYVPEKTLRVYSPAEYRAMGNYTLEDAVFLCAGKRCSEPLTKTETLKDEVKRFIAK